MKKRINKTETILNAFKQGLTLSPLDAWKIAKTLCLAEIVRDLKKRYNCKFKTEYVTQNGARFARYILLRRA